MWRSKRAAYSLFDPMYMCGKRSFVMDLCYSAL